MDNENTANTANEQTPLRAKDFASGKLELAVPIRARGEDLHELEYDFLKLTGWEYAEAMDEDKDTRNVFVVSKKQAMSLFAAACAKCNKNIDAHDVKKQLSIMDAQRAVQVASLFLMLSAQAEGKNTYGA